MRTACIRHTVPCSLPSHGVLSCILLTFCTSFPHRLPPSTINEHHSTCVLGHFITTLRATDLLPVRRRCLVSAGTNRVNPTCVLAVTASWSACVYAVARETYGRVCPLCYLLPVGRHYGTVVGSCVRGRSRDARRGVSSLLLRVCQLRRASAVYHFSPRGRRHTRRRSTQSLAADRRATVRANRNHLPTSHRSLSEAASHPARLHVAVDDKEIDTAKMQVQGQLAAQYIQDVMQAREAHATLALAAADGQGLGPASASPAHHHQLLAAAEAQHCTPGPHTRRPPSTARRRK